MAENLTESQKAEIDQLLKESQILLNDKDYQGAIRRYSRILELNPDNDLAWHGIGFARAHLGRPDETNDDTKPKHDETQQNHEKTNNNIKKYLNSIRTHMPVVGKVVHFLFRWSIRPVALFVISMTAVAITALLTTLTGKIILAVIASWIAVNIFGIDHSITGLIKTVWENPLVIFEFF